MLSNFYIDNFNYQENALPRQNMLDGHEVRIIASTEILKTPDALGYVAPSSYKNADGIDVFRIPYRKILPHRAMKKIRAYPGVYAMIEEFNPDIIFFHGASAYEILTVARYKKRHPSVRLLVDNHVDRYNSALTFVSRELLHRRFYGPILRRALPHIDKILCISLDVMEFVHTMYKIPLAALEFYPLGGAVITPEERKERGHKLRSELGMENDAIIMLHTGRMSAKKRTTELLDAFSLVPNPRFRLILIGSLRDDIKEDAERLIAADRRILYLGWKKSCELSDFLCASDLYLQPGTQSATMQSALCAGSPLLLYPYKSHEPYLKGNGFFVETRSDIIDAFQTVGRDPEILHRMAEASHTVAKELLDYKMLAERMYR
jgi:glycosyltransferase involved in cell wall biosynthesis